MEVQCKFMLSVVLIVFMTDNCSVLCDVSHLNGGAHVHHTPSSLGTAGKFIVIAARDGHQSNHRIDLLKLKLRNDQQQFMAINGLVETRFNEIKPYVYETPQIPFDEGTPSDENESREDIELTTVRPRTNTAVPENIPEKLEDFGYSYDRPLKPMVLPNHPIKLTNYG